MMINIIRWKAGFTARVITFVALQWGAVSIEVDLPRPLQRTLPECRRPGVTLILSDRKKGSSCLQLPPSLRSGKKRVFSNIF